MKIEKTLLAFTLLIISTILLTSIVYAGFSIRVEKDVPNKELGKMPAEITFNIYDSEEAINPVASQSFLSGEWSADYNFYKYTTQGEKIVRFKADFTNTEDLARDMELWVGIELDGVVVGEREQIKNESWAMFSNDTKWKENGIDIYYNDGKVGIGTTSPLAGLHIVKGGYPMSDRETTLRIEGTSTSGPMLNLRDVRLDKEQNGHEWAIGTGFAHHGDFYLTEIMAFPTNGHIPRLLIDQNGNVGIDTTNPKYKLHVNGTIGTTNEGQVHSDYVFEADYKLRSLEELEEFVKKEKHLPGVVTDPKKVPDIDIVRLNGKLLQKIEELTLYIIEEHKKTSSLEAKVKKLENQIK